MGGDTITLGCRLNFAESEAMRGLAADDVIIVNSCAVTNEAVRQTRQAIRRAWRADPERAIIVTGAAHGIGRAYSERLASDGATVALLDIDGPRNDEVAAGIVLAWAAVVPNNTANRATSAAPTSRA